MIIDLKLLSVIFLGAAAAGCSSGGGGSTTPGDTTPPIDIPGFDLTAPDTREDGSGLSLSAIAGYRVYYGTVAGDYQSQVELDSVDPVFDFTGLEKGKYFAVFTTVDTDGRESLYSDVVPAEVF